jgi:ferredoxin
MISGHSGGTAIGARILRLRFFTRLSVFSFAVAGSLATHVVYDPDMPAQRMPRLLMWFGSRYEHLMMRTIFWLADRNWLQHPVAKKGINLIAALVMRVVSGEVLSYDEGQEMVNALFDSGATVAIGTCPCRRARRIYSTDVPNETDMVFGKWAREYIANYPEYYREISREEALEMLDVFDRSGFVRQVYGFNDSHGVAFVMCNCADDVCIPLHAMRTIGINAYEKGRSRAVVDAELCKGTASCGRCLARCRFNARMPEGKAAVIEENCMGCGLCVTGCPSGASSLSRVPGAHLHYARDLLKP